MHTQTASLPEHPARVSLSLHVAIGLGLYLLTLAVEAVLGAGARWLLVFLGASALGVIVTLGTSAGLLASVAAFAPLAWSALALLAPGGGRLWRWRVGARRPAADEARDLAAALAQLDVSPPDDTGLIRFHVLDCPLPAAAVRGRSIMLSRPLFESGCLAGVLAHELGHAESLDGRLTEALARLRLWGDPLRPADDGAENPHRGQLLLGPARWTLRLPGGGAGERLLWPLWAPQLALARVRRRLSRRPPRTGRGPGAPPGRLPSAPRCSAAPRPPQSGGAPAGRAPHRAPAPLTAGDRNPPAHRLAAKRRENQ